MVSLSSGFHSLQGNRPDGDGPQEFRRGPVGKSDDVPNLFIADASTFVTAGAAHATLTLMALAARL